MVLIFGGAYQGKLTWAVQQYGLRADELCDLAHGALAIDALKDEAAHFIQVDVADPGPVKKFLGDPGVKAPVDHVDGHFAALIRVPAVFLRDHRDIIQKIFRRFL